MSRNRENVAQRSSSLNDLDQFDSPEGDSGSDGENEVAENDVNENVSFQQQGISDIRGRPVGLWSDDEYLSSGDEEENDNSGTSYAPDSISRTRATLDITALAPVAVAAEQVEEVNEQQQLPLLEQQHNDTNPLGYGEEEVGRGDVFSMQILGVGLSSDQ